MSLHGHGCSDRTIADWTIIIHSNEDTMIDLLKSEALGLDEKQRDFQKHGVMSGQRCCCKFGLCARTGNPLFRWNIDYFMPFVPMFQYVFWHWMRLIVWRSAPIPIWHIYNLKVAVMLFENQIGTNRVRMRMKSTDIIMRMEVMQRMMNITKVCDQSINTSLSIYVTL